MKFKVLNREVSKEKKVYFKLEDFGDGIELLACDYNGQLISTILEISPNKPIKLFPFVSKETGLLINDYNDGRVELV
jgi:hypothetical protein